MKNRKDYTLALLSILITYINDINKLYTVISSEVKNYKLVNFFVYYVVAY